MTSNRYSSTIRRAAAALTLASALCLLVPGPPASAQGRRPRKPTRAELIQEQDRLKRIVDSLQAQIDSLTVAAGQRTDSVRVETVPYDPFEAGGIYVESKADSMISLWTIQSRLSFMEADTLDYNRPVLSPDATDEQYMERLSKMGTVMQIPYNEAVRTFIERYSLKWKGRMPQVLSLCYYYMPIFEEALDRYGLPRELKVLPIIESLLDPTATSRAGARGLWQFMLGAGRSYGLRVDNFVDERLDPYKASDAGARLLRDSYNVFGDWSLAISAYNCGMGRVQKAIQRAGGKTDYWSVYPYLPKETRNYVPSFVGMLYTIHYRRELGIEPAEILMPLHTDTYEVSGKLHLGQVSSLMGIPIEEVRILNPQYYRDIIPDDYAQYPLNLPHSYAGVFQERRDSLATHKASEFLTPAVLQEPAGQRVASTSKRGKGSSASSGSSRGGNRIAYKVKSGDTLSGIASRHRCTVKQLKQWNNLRSDKLKVGQVLYIHK